MHPRAQPTVFVAVAVAVLALSCPASALETGANIIDPTSSATTLDIASQDDPATRIDAEQNAIAALLQRLAYPDNLARGIARFNTAVTERKLADIRDRRSRERKRGQLKVIADRIEAALAWESLQPLGIAAYGNAFDADQLSALSAFLDTPAGALYIDKAYPACVDGGIEQALYLDAKIDALFDRPADAQAPPLKPARLPKPGSAQGKALRWLRLHDPDADAAFDEMKVQAMQDMSKAILRDDPNGSLPDWAHTIMDAYRSEIRLIDLELIAANVVAKQLTSTELDDLITAFDDPHVADLMRRHARAGRHLSMATNALVQEKLQPGLMVDLMRVLANDD